MSTIFPPNEVLGYAMVTDPSLGDWIYEIPAGVPYSGTYKLRFGVTHLDPAPRIFAVLLFRGGAWTDIAGLGPGVPMFEMTFNMNAGELLAIVYADVNSEAGVGAFAGMISYSLIAGTPPFI